MFFEHFDLAHWVMTIGYIGILLIIFLETGLFFGFFLPGDSLLFTAGLLASQHYFHIWILVPSMIFTAILGYQIGYWFGKKLGGWLMKREDSFWFKRRYIVQAKSFYDEYGRKALIFGRLLPIVRTFIPIVAGMVKMTPREYFIFNIIGGFVWAGGVTLLGYGLGNIIPDASKYIIPVVLVIIVLSIAPGIWKYLKSRRRTA